MNFRVSQIPALWHPFSSAGRIAGSARGEELQLNKRADANWRLQSEAP
jgi:hypothetical protein